MLARSSPAETVRQNEARQSQGIESSWKAIRMIAKEFGRNRWTKGYACIGIKARRGLFIFLTTVLCVSVLIGVSACGGISSSGSYQSAIIGKWERVSTTSKDIFTSYDILEFFKDGTVNDTSDLGSLAGNYRFIDENSIRIDMFLSLVYEVTVSNNVLTFSNQMGEVTKYQRVGNR